MSEVEVEESEKQDLRVSHEKGKYILRTTGNAYSGEDYSQLVSAIIDHIRCFRQSNGYKPLYKLSFSDEIDLSKNQKEALEDIVSFGNDVNSAIHYID